MDASVARRLRDCLDTAELCACLDEYAPGRDVTWSVVVPGASGDFSVLLAGNGTSTGSFDSDTIATLQAIFEAGNRVLRAVGNPRSLRGGEPPVAAASTLFFRDEKYGLFLLYGDVAVHEDVAWWQEVVDALSAEIVKVQLYESANRESQASSAKLEALNEAGELVRYVELNVLLTKLMDLSVRIVRAQVGAIALVKAGRVEAGFEWGLSEDVLLALRTRTGEPFLEHCLALGEPVLVADAASSPLLDVAGLAVSIQSLLVVPLVVQERRLGAIVLVNSDTEAGLREEDADVLRTVANLCAAALDNAMLYEEMRRSERMTAEMNLAADIQNALLPGEYPDAPELELRGWCMSASETGGDFYDFFDMGNDRTAIVIGDATGHGMGAALFVFIARATFKALLTRTTDLEDIVRTMNDLLEADSEDEHFLTFFFGVFDRRTRVLSFTSAGHDPPFIYHPSTDSFVEERATGIPLGIFAGSRFPTMDVALGPGDFLVFGTDGIWEAANARGEQYGKARLKSAIRAHHARPLVEASEAVRQDILDFHEGAPRRDDITAVFMRVK